MLLGTILFVLLIGGGVFGLLKYRATLTDDDARDRGQLTDEMLVALAKEHERRERASSGLEPDGDRLSER